EWIEGSFGKDQIDLVLGARLCLAVEPRADGIGIELVKADVAATAHRANHGQCHHYFGQCCSPCPSSFHCYPLSITIAASKDCRERPGAVVRNRPCVTENEMLAAYPRGP